MTKPLRVQRTVKTFTEDYGFQPRWSNRDQIYPSMLNIWKKKNWINYESIIFRYWITSSMGRWSLWEMKQMRWVLRLLQLTPWINFQAILRERKRKQVISLSWKDIFESLRRLRQLRFAGNDTGEERAAWKSENVTDGELRGPAGFSQPWTTRGIRVGNSLCSHQPEWKACNKQSFR